MLKVLYGTTHAKNRTFILLWNLQTRGPQYPLARTHPFKWSPVWLVCPSGRNGVLISGSVWIKRCSARGKQSCIWCSLWGLFGRVYSSVRLAPCSRREAGPPAGPQMGGVAVGAGPTWEREMLSSCSRPRALSLQDVTVDVNRFSMRIIMHLPPHNKKLENKPLEMEIRAIFTSDKLQFLQTNALIRRAVSSVNTRDVRKFSRTAPLGSTLHVCRKPHQHAVTLNPVIQQKGF